MKVLFLDDRGSRCDIFEEKILEFSSQTGKPISISYAHSAHECIDDLCRFKYDVLFLDHDLNDEVDVEPWFMPANNGMTVVNFLCSGTTPVAKIVIHSDAPEARKMRDLLCAAQYNAYRSAFGEFKWLDLLK